MKKLLLDSRLIFALKREYWECKKQLVTVPLIVTALFFLMAFVATWNHHASDAWLHDIDISEQQSEASDLSTEPLSESEEDVSKPERGEDDTFWFSGAYLAAAWLSAMFYALSSLYNDRRDKSILYWKTMPVSEVQTVFAKMVFAVFGFSLVAILISWVSAAFLMAYAHIVFPSDMLPNATEGMSFSKLVIWPLLTILIAFIWCAPVFSLLLYISARAKKMPVLLLIIGVVVVRVVENIVLSSDRIFGFLHSHSPFGLISQLSKFDNTSEFLSLFLASAVPSLVLGLIIASLLIWRAAWHRNHNFEI